MSLPLAIALWANVVAANIPDENPIFHALVTAGVPVGSGAPLTLPEPTMADGLDAKGQHGAMISVTDANHPLDQLLRKSVVAPFVLKIRTEGNATGERTGRRVDLWFIAHGDFEKILERDFFERHFSEEAKAEAEKEPLPTKSQQLKPDELAKRQLNVTDTDTTKEGYVWGTFSIFDRVQVSGTAHMMQTRHPNSVVAASSLDAHFTDDAEYPNRWWSIDRDAMGNPSLAEPPHPYAGSGSYVKATRLLQPQGAIFIEWHLVFDEPHGWFNGANLLRSKLPIVVQDNVRKFRRELAKEAPAK